MDLAHRIHQALPQTQCRRCEQADCLAYAQAIANGQAPINQCPPGGQEGVRRLAAITELPQLPLNPDNGLEGPLTLAVIDEQWCIGCTLCIKACPTDAIIGTNKHMHTVLASACTGCELCIPVCPVDCIDLVPVSGNRSGWYAWSDAQAQQALQRYTARQIRLQREQVEHQQGLAAKARFKQAHLAELTHSSDAAALQRKRAIVEAALQRAQQRQASTR